MSYKIHTSEAAFEADREHLNKLRTAEGHRIPETPAQHISGKRVDRGKIDWDKVLCVNVVSKRKHPTKDEWSYHVGEFASKHSDHVDPTTLHKLDHKDAVAKLPDDWAAALAVAAIKDERNAK